MIVEPHGAHRSMSRAQGGVIGAVAFVAGIGTMALEMAAIRLLAPIVGQTALVWASLIGVVLIQLACGYRFGGYIAERSPRARTLAVMIAGAAAAIFVIALAGRPLLERVVQPIVTAGAAGGEVLATLVAGVVLLSVPVVLLSTVPPFTLRLAVDLEATSGRTAGALYALSTTGSIIGTLGPALVTIPWLGVRATLMLVAAIVLVAAALALLITARSAADETARARMTDELGQDGAPLRTRTPLTLLVFAALTGYATMTSELAVARLAAPFFGASTIVWACLIGLVLAYLAGGSYVGGRVADRWPQRRSLASWAMVAAVLLAALPFVAAAVMRGATAGVESGTVETVVRAFGSLLLVLAPSVFTLGMLTPWIVRLCIPAGAGARGSGRAAGRVYAASTVGAVVGTFTTSLMLVPQLGTRRTLESTALALLIAAFVLAPRAPRVLVAGGAAIIVVAVAAAIPVAQIKPLDQRHVIFEGESPYQFVQVNRDPAGRTLLQLNEGWAIHSIHAPDTVLAPGIWNHYIALPALLDWSTPTAAARPTGDMHALMLGSAAATTPRAWAAVWPKLRIDGVELDPLVLDVARRYFGMDQIPRFTVHQGDARPWLARTDQRWDLIHIDAYRQPYIPFHLATREFFRLVRDHLGRRGVVSINVGSAPGHTQINRAIAATMRSVFPTVIRYRPAGEFNELIVGWADPAMTIDRARERLVRNEPMDPLADASDNRRLQRVFAAFADGMRGVDEHPDRVMTDDHAPVEWMTDLMIARAAEHPGEIR